MCSKIMAVSLAVLAFAVCCDALLVPEDLDQFRQEALDAINKQRALFGSPAVAIDGELNERAQRLARSVAEKSRLQATNDNYGPFGEIIYSSPARVVTAEDAVENWGAQVAYFDPEHPDFHVGYGQGTQLVWRDARQVGIGAAMCGSRRTSYIVAAFDQGNEPGRFTENVPVAPSRVRRFLKSLRRRN